MKIHFLRHATLIVHSGSQQILVDPMLSRKGGLPPLAYVRHRPRRNPTVDLPPDAVSALQTITAGLITHCRRGHLDHLDRPGTRLLAERQVPVYCNGRDRAYLRRRGIRTVPLHAGQLHEFFGGTITPVETAHGYGVIGKLMGPGLGYLIELPGEPSLYLSGDTVLTPTVGQVLAERRPHLSILAAGSASLDLGRPILMPMEELLEFVVLAPGTVIANHLEAFNHCPTTRAGFREAVVRAGMAQKVRIPEDGEVLEL